MKLLTRSPLSLIAALLGLSLFSGCDGAEDNPEPVDAGGTGQQQTPSTTPPKSDAGSAGGDASAPAGPTTQDASSTAPNPQDGSTPTLDAGNTGGERDASSPAVDAGGGDAASEAGPAVMPGSVLPPTTDPAMPGPFMVDVVQTAPGLTSHMLYVPRELGKDGIKHPIVVWTNGNGASSSYYDPFLRHIASHGFFLVVDKRSTSMRETEYAEQKQGIDWAAQQAASTSGTYAGKLDGSRIGIMGHSMGSLSSFVNGGDPRVRTSIHWSGGLVGNPTGTDEGALQKLHAPAAFLCGGADGQAGPACANDFWDAPPKLPVFYGTLAGVGHLGVFGDRNGGEYGRMGVAWLRWKLAADESFRSWFAGAACKACMRPWTGMGRNLE
ncbi:MAG TPA: hypothetical protein VFZ61_32485 [Polyangiales bacterium]